jgi:hypothetical protein
MVAEPPPSSAQLLAQQESERSQSELTEKRARATQFRKDMRERLAAQARRTAEAPAVPQSHTGRASVAESRKAEMVRGRQNAAAQAAKERQDKLDLQRETRLRGVARSADVQRLHDLAREQRERQLGEERALQAEAQQREAGKLEKQRDKVAARRSSTALRATLTDKMDSMSVELPPLSPSGGGVSGSTAAHTRQLCWGVDGWCAPAANCPFKDDMHQHDLLLRQMVEQWG